MPSLEQAKTTIVGPTFERVAWTTRCSMWMASSTPLSLIFLCFCDWWSIQGHCLRVGNSILRAQLLMGPTKVKSQLKWLTHPYDFFVYSCELQVGKRIVIKFLKYSPFRQYSYSLKLTNNVTIDIKISWTLIFFFNFC